MKFSYQWLKELYPKAGSPENVAEHLTFHSFTVESIKKIGKDFAIDIDSKALGRRAADASGHIGIARELAVIGEKTFSPPAPRIAETSPSAARDLLSIKVAARGLVPRYAARVIERVHVGPSPKWIYERLATCGLRPINVVVDITNYVMLETGQPLHAFDYDRLRGGTKAKKEIIVRLAKNGERLHTLDNQAITLRADDLVIADPEGAIALAGIKGGMGSEIRGNTTRVVLEGANFDPATVRKTSQRVKLATDASWRFRHGMDPEGIPYALDRAAALLEKFAGGRVLKGIADEYPKKDPTRSIPFSLAKAEALLGTKIPEREAKRILLQLGCQIQKIPRNTWQVKPPSFRKDLAIEEDLIEEVGRMWGYEKIPAELPVIRGGVPRKSELQLFERMIRTRLAGFGFTEAHLSSFVGERVLHLFGLDARGLFSVENPANPDSAFLVNSPALPYIRITAENLRHFNSVKLFGIARAFFKTPGGPVESLRLLMTHAERGKDGREEFYALKGAVETLLESFGISEYRYDETSHRRVRWAHPYRIADVKVDNTIVGVIGEVSAKVQEALKSKSRIVAAEFSLERLLAEITQEQEFLPLSKFPAVIRDIAVIVPEGIKTETVTNIIENACGPLLADSDLFDYFQDETMEERSEKSLAFHLIFQSPDRTLTDKEVDQLYRKVAAALRTKNWEIRE